MEPASDPAMTPGRQRQDKPPKGRSCFATEHNALMLNGERIRKETTLHSLQWNREGSRIVGVHLTCNLCGGEMFLDMKKWLPVDAKDRRGS